MPQRQLMIEGRKLTVYDEGDPAGPAILIHHGTPAAGPPYFGWVEDVNARGARLVGYDRARVRRIDGRRRAHSW